MRLVHFILLSVMLLLSGCVSESEAVAYARRAHPECSSFRAESHSYNSGSETVGSQTEVSMLCSEVRRSVTVKCIHGFGVVSDTTFHENN